MVILDSFMNFQDVYFLVFKLLNDNDFSFHQYFVIHGLCESSPFDNGLFPIHNLKFQIIQYKHVKSF